ncbi:FAST kinase domain-containing protein 1, mitochondrial-like isoform X2 [Ptychodera flava]|uniref:FAST kinase domain-containing protein 1, mitochondrial-like isoform X2 n=1 Tax=Ptychodera flava TaxID=63121 RepID=UPI003969E0C6
MRKMFKPGAAVFLKGIGLQCRIHVPFVVRATSRKLVPILCLDGIGFKRNLSQTVWPAVLTQDNGNKFHAENGSHVYAESYVENIIADIIQVDTVGELFDVIDNYSGTPLPCEVSSAALSRLHHLQKMKPKDERNFEKTLQHPAGKMLLASLADNAVHCDTTALLSSLYTLTYLPGGCLASGSAVQRLLEEAQRRLDTMNFAELAKFVVCLQFMNRHNSPVTGRVAELMRKNLNCFQAQDLPSFAILMDAVIHLSSGKFQAELMTRTLNLLSSGEPNELTIRKILYAMENANNPNQLLIEKCMFLLQPKIEEFDTKWLYMLSMFYHKLECRNESVRGSILCRVNELLSECKDPDDVSRLFEMAIKHGSSSDIVGKIETILLEKLDCISLESFVRLCSAVSWSNYWSPVLTEALPRVLARLLKNASHREVIRISKNHMLQDLDVESVNRIHGQLMCALADNINPSNVPRIVRSLSYLPEPFPESHSLILQKVVSSYHMFDIHKLSLTIRALRNILNHPFLKSPVVKRRKFVSTMNRLNTQCFLLLENMNQNSSEASTGRESHQLIAWKKLPQVANFLVKNRLYYSNILDNIAQTIPEHVYKMSLSQLNSILTAYSQLNHRPPNADEFYQACIKACLGNLQIWRDPMEVVDCAYQLAIAQYFPEDLISFIFSVRFLEKLDQVIERSTVGFRKQVQGRLMKLNRCIQLECPEMKLPWFHDQFMHRGQSQTVTILDNIEIHLTNILGGPEYFRRSVFTPYLYKLELPLTIWVPSISAPTRTIQWVTKR